MAEEIKTAVEIVVALVAVVSAVQAHKSKVAAEAAAKRIETDQRLHEALRLALDVGVSQQVARHRLSALRRDYNTLFNAAGSYGGSAHKELQAQIDEHEKKLDAARETAAPFQGGLDRLRAHDAEDFTRIIAVLREALASTDATRALLDVRATDLQRDSDRIAASRRAK
jgi:hypothetical protein